MHMLCLDVEGVLFPELWVEIAQALGIAELRLTTQDVPDFNALMARRVAILKARGVTLQALQRCIAGVRPLPGAAEFVAEVRQDFQLVLVSDSFYEFLLPLLGPVGTPALFCHHLLHDEQDRVCGWRPRLPDQKPKVARAMRELGFTVFAAGDSYNDLDMLMAADGGWFVNAPANIERKFPDLPRARGLQQLLRLLRQARTLPSVIDNAQATAWKQ